MNDHRACIADFVAVMPAGKRRRRSYNVSSGGKPFSPDRSVAA
jgi:hypothetical protein